MSKEGSQSAEAMDKDKQEYWDKEREVFRGRVGSFIAQMHLVQGIYFQNTYTILPADS